MPTPRSSSPIWLLVRALSAANVRVYRASGGRLGGRLERAPVLILHHVGRRSGKARVAPILYEDCQRQADRVIPVVVLEPR